MANPDILPPPMPLTAAAAAPPWHADLRTKGILATFALVAYLALAAAFYFAQREAMLREFDELDRIHHVQRTLNELTTAVARASADVAAGGDRQSPGQFAVVVAGISAQSREFAKSERDLAAGLDALEAAAREYAAGTAREGVAPVARGSARVLAALDVATRQANADGQLRTDAFRERSLTVAVTTLTIGVLGVALVAAALVLFLARITADLRALRRGARAIIAGDRRPMPVTRTDEVGEVAVAVNELATTLAARERDLARERREAVQREKMAAIGALAAGVAAEIGNPIAAIDGYARAAKEALALRGDPSDACDAGAILEQTARLTVIARRIAAIAVPQPSERQLCDVNAIVENAVGLARFDPGLSALPLDLDLDRQLPAVPAVADRLLALVHNLVGNVVGSVATPAGTGRVRIRTGLRGADVVVEVDTAGIPASGGGPRRTAAADWSLAESIVEEHGGRLDVDALEGGAARAVVTLPLGPPDDYG